MWLRLVATVLYLTKTFVVQTLYNYNNALCYMQCSTTSVTLLQAHTYLGAHTCGKGRSKTNLMCSHVQLVKTPSGLFIGCCYGNPTAHQPFSSQQRCILLPRCFRGVQLHIPLMVVPYGTKGEYRTLDSYTLCILYVNDMQRQELLLLQPDGSPTIQLPATMHTSTNYKTPHIFVPQLQTLLNGALCPKTMFRVLHKTMHTAQHSSRSAN